MAAMKRMRGTLEERLFHRLVPEGDCLVWPGQRDKDGYGRIQDGDEPLSTHRTAWELRNRPLEPGEMVLHRCDNPPCCNPDHLFVGSNADNVADMAAKGRDNWGWQKRKTHCSKGHPFTPENTRMDGTARVCRTCKGWKGLTP